MTTIRKVDDMEEEDCDDGEGFGKLSQRMSRLSIEGIVTDDGEDADAEVSDEEGEEVLDGDLFTKDEFGDANYRELSSQRRRRRDWSPRGTTAASLPATPNSSSSTTPSCCKMYASETDGRARSEREKKRSGRRWSTRRTRDAGWLNSEWDINNPVAGVGGKAAAVIREERQGHVCSGVRVVDLDEVRACKDLGLELPEDWMVEIPFGGAFSGFDTSSGGNSPVGSWQISSPGDDPKEVKAKLKIWARAVALASASHLNT